MAKSNFSLADLNRYYAMIICRMSDGTRLKIYRKLISLLHNRFSLMDALDRVRGIITNDEEDIQRVASNVSVSDEIMAKLEG